MGRHTGFGSKWIGVPYTSCSQSEPGRKISGGSGKGAKGSLPLVCLLWFGVEHLGDWMHRDQEAGVREVEADCGTEVVVVATWRVAACQKDLRRTRGEAVQSVSIDQAWRKRRNHKDQRLVGGRTTQRRTAQRGA